MESPAIIMIAAGLLSPTNVPRETAKLAGISDLGWLQGTWVAQTYVISGVALSERELRTIKLVVTGSRYAYRMEQLREKGLLRLDPTRRPKAIDIQITEGPQKGLTQLGIYELSPSSFKLCVALADDRRPKRFASMSNSRRALLVFKRLAE
jgi:uncharacterized protein (TIGR03067 family)